MVLVAGWVMVGLGEMCNQGKMCWMFLLGPRLDGEIVWLDGGGGLTVEPDKYS